MDHVCVRTHYMEILRRARITPNSDGAGRITHVNYFEPTRITISYVGDPTYDIDSTSPTFGVVATNTDGVGAVAHVNHLQPFGPIGNVGVGTFYLDTPSYPTGVVAPNPNGMGRISHVYHLEALTIFSNVGVRPHDVDVYGTPTGVVTTNTDGVDEVAHVKHLQPRSPIAQIGVRAHYLDAPGRSTGIDAANPERLGGVTHINHFKAGIAGYVSIRTPYMDTPKESVGIKATDQNGISGITDINYVQPCKVVGQISVGTHHMHIRGIMAKATPPDWHWVGRFGDVKNTQKARFRLPHKSIGSCHCDAPKKARGKANPHGTGGVAYVYHLEATLANHKGIGTNCIDGNGITKGVKLDATHVNGFPRVTNFKNLEATLANHIGVVADHLKVIKAAVVANMDRAGWVADVEYHEASTHRDVGIIAIYTDTSGSAATPRRPPTQLSNRPEIALGRDAAKHP
jgi:hypothetical protein